MNTIMGRVAHRIFIRHRTIRIPTVIIGTMTLPKGNGFRVDVTVTIGVSMAVFTEEVYTKLPSTGKVSPRISQGDASIEIITGLHAVFH